MAWRVHSITTSTRGGVRRHNWHGSFQTSLHTWQRLDPRSLLIFLGGVQVGVGILSCLLTRHTAHQRPTPMPHTHAHTRREYGVV